MGTEERALVSVPRVHGITFRTYGTGLLIKLIAWYAKSRNSRNQRRSPAKETKQNL